MKEMDHKMEPESNIVVFCDGASNPKRKVSGIGCVWFETRGDDEVRTDRKVFHELSEKIRHCTNNEAEYRSLIRALETTVALGIPRVSVFMDSKLVVKQVNGEWKINFPHLQALKNEVDTFRKNVDFDLFHVPREQNRHADKLSKKSLV